MGKRKARERNKKLRWWRPGGRPKAGRHRPMIHRERHTETLRDTERKREERDALRQREIEIQRQKGQRCGDRERQRGDGLEDGGRERGT